MSAPVIPRPVIARINPSVVGHADEYRERFVAAEPYKHIAIDDFFDEGFAEELLDRFPAFNPALAKNELYKGVFGKAVNENIRAIAPVYHSLYELVASDDFRDAVSRITGIPGLLMDPKYYGGGTHENLHGQALDPHVDFNYDESQKLHRRLNLIVYLNKDWREEWGGGLEVHSNPRNQLENTVKTYNPLFNRAILFETNEYSWHGFPRIDLPPTERHRSRKSISIYLYTRERPAHEIAPMHATFYVQRPLEKRFQPGYTLTEADLKYLLAAIDGRDKWIEFYQRMELNKNAEIAEKAKYIREILSRVRAPLTGYVRQDGNSEGLYSEGWTAKTARFVLKPLEPLKRLTVKGWRPGTTDAAGTVEVRIDGEPRGTAQVGYGDFEIPVEFEPACDKTITVEISSDPVYQPEGDNRELGFMLMEVRATGYIPEPPTPVQVPLTGYVFEEGTAEGLYSEGWTAPIVRFGIKPLEPVTSLTVKGWRPDAADPNATIEVRIDGEPRATVEVGHGVFEIPVAFEPACEAPISVEISSHPVYRPEGDKRELGFVLMEARAGHRPDSKDVTVAPAADEALTSPDGPASEQP